MAMWKLDEVVHVIVDCALIGPFLTERSLNITYGRILESCAIDGIRLHILKDLEDKRSVYGIWRWGGEAFLVIWDWPDITETELVWPSHAVESL